MHHACMYLHTLVASLPQAERAALVQATELRSYRRNESVLAADEWTDSIYCVASGLLRVVAHGSSSGGDVTTDFIRQDDFFLGPSFGEDRYRVAHTLIAALPSSVYLIPVSEMRRLCASHPEITLKLLAIAMERMSAMRGQLRRVSSFSSEDLVGRVLHQLAQLAPSSTGGYDKRITQAVIASYSGLSREVVNKTMRNMEDRGLVRRDEHGLHVPAEFAATDFQSLMADPGAFGPAASSLNPCSPND
ncbi:CRP/FNR family cyclic AMP-dependent transcriptional regulator [Variovorax paradoxus]|jgi:CRP/FNR family transcriptional regulator, cyclic AMP receptor protein|uniref:Crp/Fnr family transcriptional regulator n=1 Tax=Variovorax paradoxus TaxID=34073 RepID=UPI002793CC19|nr:CRP/FNR family cyclic AMP-dependent transcriptional regulator [Variovorax paradoxus]